MNNEERKNFIKKKKLPLSEAWSLVAMADRVNEGMYIKFPEFDQDTGVVAKHPNRELIRTQLALGCPNVTETDRQFGLAMHDHFQGIAFKALSDRLNEFDQKIMNFITQDEVDTTMGMAYLACMAVRYRRELAKETKDEVLLRVGGTSMHQGSIDQHLRLRVQVMSKFEGRAFPGSVVRATDGTNLYFWTSSKMIDMWPDAPEEFEIVGVVKTHQVDRDGNAETRLTRVKLII
jgi:hypothetical protein